MSILNSMLMGSAQEEGPYFDVLNYEGTGAPRDVTGLSFKPDIVIIKSYSADTKFLMFNAIRGPGKYVSPNLPGAELNEVGTLTAFINGGFSLANSSLVNDNGGFYVAYCWRMPETNGSNEIYSAKNSMSLVYYTGNNTAGRVISHSMGDDPHLILIKNLSASDSWVAYNRNKGWSYPVDTDGARVINTSFLNNTDPTVTGVTIGNTDDVNQSGEDYLMWILSQNNCDNTYDSYVGNGSSTGPEVSTDNKTPKLLVVKRRDSQGVYYMYDNTRDLTNPKTLALRWDLSQREYSPAPGVDFTATGFKIKSSDSSINRNGDTYIYWAWCS